MSKVEIVPYEDKYRDAVRRCVYDTGYGGRSAKFIFTDRELFADFLTLYYTDYEPEHSWLGLVDGEPAGYMLGSIDTAACDRIMKKEVYPKILKKLLRGGYRMDRLNVRYIRRALQQLLRRELTSPPLGMYPAHLHIDLFKQFRRNGLGTRLIHTWLDTLREKGVPGVHLGTSSAHNESLPFYRKLGFQQYAVRRVTTSYFKELTDEDLYSIWFVMNLSHV